MNWKIKAHLLAVTSRLPGGKDAYHLAQRLAGTNRLQAEESLRRCFEVVDLIRAGGQDVSGAKVVEIGTGWRPFLPMVLRLAGAERIVTFDVNPWLTHRYAIETCDAIAARLEKIADRLGFEQSAVQDRYATARKHDQTLEGLLTGFSIEYRCPADARRTGLEAGTMDVVCSTNVLEHIPGDMLTEIHNESFRVLSSGGISVHRIDPGDHFRLVDGSITGANFLRYSKDEWHWYGGSGLSYHNRLRCVEHRRLLESSGFNVPVERIRTDERAAAAIRSGELSVHEDFRHFTPEELAGDLIAVVGVKPNSAGTFSARNGQPSLTTNVNLP